MKFLIIKTSALGDIVHTFPAIQLIRQLFPEAIIDWVVEKHCSNLLQAHPFINRLILIETKNWRNSLIASFKEIKKSTQEIRGTNYDFVIDFQGNVKSGIIMGLSRAKKKVGFGWKSVPEWPNLFFSNHRIDSKPGLNIREDYLSLVEGLFHKKGTQRQTLLEINNEERKLLNQLIHSKHDRSNILVCPGSNWENKRLSEATWIDFLQGLDQNSKFWIIQNSVAEMQFGEVLKKRLKDAEVLPVLSLPLLQNWMVSMDMVIAMDSLPLHLAAEAGVATFSVFGPSLAKKYGPLGPLHQSIQGSCPYGQAFEKRCPKLRTCKTGACIKDLTAKNLFKILDHRY